MKTATDRITLSRLVKNPHLAFTLLSAVLLALGVGVAFLKPCPITPYFLYVALAATLITVRFRGTGIALAYGVITFYLIYFYPSIDPQMRLWQMGVIFTLALTTFIFLLSFEEAEEHVSLMEKQIDEKGGAYSAITEQITQLEQEYSEKQKGFEEEIERLKQEAGLRLLERQQDKSNLELLTSEIELLTSQKQEILSQKQTHAPGHVHVERDAPDLKRLEGLYKQLRQQFAEKSKVLISTRKELFKVEGELEAMKHQQVCDSLDFTEGLEKELVVLSQENQQLEDEIAALEGLISQLF